jgi:hypothetical protein
LTTSEASSQSTTQSTAFATVEQAIAEFRGGSFVIIVDDEDRENEGDLVIAAQYCGASEVNFMAREARGLICMPMLGARLAGDYAVVSVDSIFDWHARNGRNLRREDWRRARTELRQQGA